MLGVTGLHEDGEVGRHSGRFGVGIRAHLAVAVPANVKSLTGEVNAKDALDAQIGRRMVHKLFAIAPVSSSC